MYDLRMGSSSVQQETHVISILMRNISGMTRSHRTLIQSHNSFIILLYVRVLTCKKSQ